MSKKSIAIDGPSGAGKSTLARQIAKALGFLYVDTGAIYRTLALAALRRGIDPANSADVLEVLHGIKIDLGYGADGLQHMYLDGADVTEEIRTPAVSAGASAVSAIPAVRTFLMDMQRDLAASRDVVMDGRDIGTVVLPGADVKIFLTATAEERARRRYEELLLRGTEVDYETVLRDIVARDERDTSRAAAPLRQAEDAVAVDTTGKSQEESFDLLLNLIRRQLAQ
ncbi:(d)CMP kinase [Pseudoflavonifractor phocaeensis]|uniref:(d)CMP kinase n=1 Tax=Pseudoflavonifractor phocaeensis TaxID=1870988 RepID=UPI0019570215|nr:(d)CMP kinase [Pseudoflavonifractor phocaeensis]MBM6869591.1 (d)CMP kinase [Pseudoflavonifractor phocaeensis]